MNIVVERKYPRDTYTIGKLYIDGQYFCDTLEDKVRDLNKNGVFDNGEKKVYGETAIPYGSYEVKMTFSPKFSQRKAYTAFIKSGLMPEIMNAHLFTGVRIHGGNSAKDTLGCLLVGKNKIKGRLVDSLATFKVLYKKIWDATNRAERVVITFK